MAKSPTLRSTFWYEPAVRSSPARELGAERHLAFPDGSREAIDEKLVYGNASRSRLAANDDGGAGRERDRRPVAGGIVVAQAADDRAHLPHHRIGDHARCVMDEAPPPLADPRRPLDIAVPRDRADCEHLISHTQLAQIGQRVDVDQDGRAREAESHRRNEALPARQHAGLGPMLLQVCERLVCGVGPKIVEGCRNHVANLLPRQCRAWRGHAGVAKVILRKSDSTTARSHRPLHYGLMVSAVVLAAGASTRMGTQKLLLPFGNEPLICRTVRQVCAAGFDDVLVVLGQRA